MKIKNVKVYGLEESIIKSGYPMQVGEPHDMLEDSDGDLFYYANNTPTYHDNLKNNNRGRKLANTPNGSGHNNFLKGIIVQADIQYPEYFSPQLQRYHWIDIVGSQSKMHKIASIKDITDNCNKYVLTETIRRVNYLIELYNKNEFPCIYESEDDYETIDSKEECFQYIISNLPSGYLKWMGISTNYLQLKTIYSQRRTHKLNEWQEFCNWIETLPMSELIINKNK